MKFEAIGFWGAVFVSVALAAAVGVRARREVALAQTFRVPKVVHPPKVDGAIKDDVWDLRALRRPFFGADHKPMRPSTEARFAHDGATLYGLVVAMDDDVRTFGPEADAVTFTLSSGNAERTIRVGADGVPRDVDPALAKVLRTGGGHDGTPNEPRGRDRSWLVEWSLPLASLGVRDAADARIDVRGERCDRVDGKRSCGTFGERAAPITLRLE